jgi:hypothetical protein
MSKVSKLTKSSNRDFWFYYEIGLLMVRPNAKQCSKKKKKVLNGGWRGALFSSSSSRRCCLLWSRFQERPQPKCGCRSDTTTIHIQFHKLRNDLLNSTIIRLTHWSRQLRLWLLSSAANCYSCDNVYNAHYSHSSAFGLMLLSIISTPPIMQFPDISTWRAIWVETNYFHLLKSLWYVVWWI